MKLKRLDFVDGGEDGATPATVTVEMTIEEAAWIAKTSGQQRGSSPHSPIYHCLIGDVFNRYWHDGIDGYLIDNPVETPPIRYDEPKIRCEV